MEVKESEMIRIKKTKSVEMYYDEGEGIVSLYICGKEFAADWRRVDIPILKVFQVKRGLESAVQRFYRRKKK